MHMCAYLEHNCTIVLRDLATSISFPWGNTIAILPEIIRHLCFSSVTDSPQHPSHLLGRRKGGREGTDLHPLVGGVALHLAVALLAVFALNRGSIVQHSVMCRVPCRHQHPAHHALLASMRGNVIRT